MLMSDEAPAHAYRPGPRDTIMHALARAVEHNGADEFANVGGVRITYGEIDRQANAMARALGDLGIGKGHTVVTLFDTSMDVFICWFAINKLGAIWVPINTAYRGEYLRHQVTDSGARLIICDAQYLERFIEIQSQLPEVRKILCRGKFEAGLSDVPPESLDAHRGSDGSPLPIVVEPPDLACLLYTSGTTGASKGCMISHNYLCMQGRQQLRAVVPLTRDDVSWTCLPVFHAAALTIVLGALVGTLRIAIWPRFSVTTFWDDIEQSGATTAMLMASIFSLIANAPDSEAMRRCHGRLKMIYGQPITPAVRRIWQERFGVPLVSSWSYGQTEGVRLTMVEPGESPPETCAGRVTDEFELMIVDAEDRPLADGETGEIVYRPREANVMFEGYWRRPEETAKAWRNLWMHSGDLGRTENGYLHFSDRAKDYMRTRGENVSSFELERVFMNHPAIQECAAHATGPQSGEDDIKLTAVLRPGATLSELELCLWSIEKLPHFAVPRFYEFRSELIKNPTGRVLKYRLREQGVTATTWDRESADVNVRRRK
jgi:crotonobetaine/carnitine-CoA ligase